MAPVTCNEMAPRVDHIAPVQGDEVRDVLAANPTAITETLIRSMCALLPVHAEAIEERVNGVRDVARLI